VHAAVAADDDQDPQAAVHHFFRKIDLNYLSYKYIVRTAPAHSRGWPGAPCRTPPGTGQATGGAGASPAR
jgi:hypothetical protein